MTRLAADAIVVLRDAEGRDVRVSSGHVWITQTGDRRDAVLGPGEAVRLERPGVAIVQALDAAEVLLPGSPFDDDLGGPAVAPPPARDARVVHIRAVRREDAPALGAFFVQLSPLSRLRRFHSGGVRLPQAWLDRFTQPDGRREFAVLAVARQDGRDVCVGEARYAVAEDAPGDEREVALAVADAWQRRGLGAQMLDRLIRHASRQGVERLLGDVLKDNLPMIALARRFGFAASRHPDNPTLVRMHRRLAGPGDAWPA